MDDASLLLIAAGVGGLIYASKQKEVAPVVTTPVVTTPTTTTPPVITTPNVPNIPNTTGNQGTGGSTTTPGNTLGYTLLPSQLQVFGRETVKGHVPLIGNQVIISGPLSGTFEFEITLDDGSIPDVRQCNFNVIPHHNVWWSFVSPAGDPSTIALLRAFVSVSIDKISAAEKLRLSIHPDDEGVSFYGYPYVLDGYTPREDYMDTLGYQYSQYYGREKFFAPVQSSVQSWLCNGAYNQTNWKLDFASHTTFPFAVAQTASPLTYLSVTVPAGRCLVLKKGTSLSIIR